MSKTLSFTGTVNVIENLQQVTEKFSKQIITVVEDADKYPQEIPFEFVNDKADLLHKVSKGDKVTVFYNLRGSQWKDRFFVSLQAWKIEVESKASYGSEPQQGELPTSDDIEEDVPF